MGFAAESTNKRSGSLSVMSGKLWCSHTLKAEEENQSRMNCLMTGKFSSVGSQGRVGVAAGGNVLLGHWQGWSAWVGTPVLVQGDREGVVPLAAAMTELVGVLGGQEPIVGKLGGKVCNCSQQSLDR